MPRGDRSHNAAVPLTLEEPAAAARPQHRALTRRTLLRGWGIACAAYFAISLAAILVSSTYPFPVAVRSAFLQVLPDCLLAPLAFAAARRFPLGRLAGWRFALVHLIGGAAFVLLSSLGFIVLYFLERRVTSEAWPVMPALAGFVYKGFGSLLVYATVAAAGNAVEQAHRAARAEVLSAEARLAALRARLNPHFILNLLHTMMGLVGRDPASAQAALEQLGDVLRYSLRVQSQGLDEVRLREEWEFVERYLALERLRLGDRLRARLEIEEALFDAVVPVFSLQPLVENAVRHAIAPRASGGRIDVRAARSGSSILLTVEDDGGSSERVVPAAAGNGLGLRLIRERLEALYGGAARLETGPSTLGGFRAAVTVPIGETP